MRPCLQACVQLREDSDDDSYEASKLAVKKEQWRIANREKSVRREVLESQLESTEDPSKFLAKCTALEPSIDISVSFPKDFPEEV